MRPNTTASMKRVSTRQTMVAVAVAGVAALCTSGAVGCSGDEQSPTVNVGLLLPFTGEVGAMGSNLEEAAMMVADQVNANGGVAGKRLRLVVADTHSDVERGMASLNGILEQGVVAVVGPESGDVAAAVLRVLKERKVLFVSPYGTASLESTVADASYPWFRLAATPTSFGQAIAKRMLTDGHTKITIVHTDDQYNATLATAAAATMKTFGGTVLTNVSLPAGDEDHSAELMGMSAAELGVVLLSADPVSGARLVNELSVLYPSQQRQWYLAPSLKTESFVRNAYPDKIEGAIGVAPKIFVTTDRFRTQFGATWNGDLPQEGAHYYYDAMTLVALSIERAWVGAGRQDPAFEALRDAFREVARTRGIVEEWDQIPGALQLIRSGIMTYYSGLSGPFLIDEQGVRQLGTAAYWKVEGGQIVSLN